MTALLLTVLAASTGLELTADTMVFTPRSRTALATGSVEATNDDFKVNCEQARIHYVQSDGRRIIDRLDLERSVHAVRQSDGATATGQQATWKRDDGRLVLTGAPVVHRGADVVEGTRIDFGTEDETYFVNDPVVTLLENRTTPMVVTSTTLEGMPGGLLLRFDDNVRMVEDDAVTTSNRADVTLVGEGEAREVEKVTLTGKVVAVRGTQTGRAARAVWYAESRDLVMEGNPVVEQEGESITGRRITLEGATGRARVETATVKIKRKR